MSKAFLLLLVCGVLFFSGCASEDFGAMEEENRGPAPYSPDFSSQGAPAASSRGLSGN